MLSVYGFHMFSCFGSGIYFGQKCNNELFGTFLGQFYKRSKQSSIMLRGNHAGPILPASEPLLRENDSMIVCQLA